MEENEIKFPRFYMPNKPITQEGHLKKIFYFLKENACII